MPMMCQIHFYCKQYVAVRMAFQCDWAHRVKKSKTIFFFVVFRGRYFLPLFQSDIEDQRIKPQFRFGPGSLCAFDPFMVCTLLHKHYLQVILRLLALLCSLVIFLKVIVILDKFHFLCQTNNNKMYYLSIMTFPYFSTSWKM